MQVVREISNQTAEGSTATSTSIAKLAALSAQLRKSVAGFRLPDYGGGTTTAVGMGTAAGKSAGRNPATNGATHPPSAVGGTSLEAGAAAAPGLPALNGPVTAGNSGKMRKASGASA
jgi:hypothetical protein